MPPPNTLTPEELQNIRPEELEDIRPEELEDIDLVVPLPTRDTTWSDSPAPEDLEDLTPEELKRVNVIQQPQLTAWEPTRKSLWMWGKDRVRRMLSPLLGATQAQIDEDAHALLEADPKALEKYFDENGELTGAGANAWDGLMRGIDQLQGLGYGLGMWGSDIAGADRLKSWLKDKWLANQAQIEANPAAVGTFKRIGAGYERGLKGFLPRLRHSLTYGVEAVTQNIPTMVPSLVTGGVTGAVAKKVITRGLEKELLEMALQQSAKKIAAAELAGVMLGSAGIETGSIYSDMVERGIEGPVPAMVALAGGLAAGSLEAITPFLALRRIGGAAAEVPKSPVEMFVRSTLGDAMMEKGLVRLGVRGFEGALTESPTEFLQTAIEQAARLSQDPTVQGQFWETFWRGYGMAEERLEAAIQGGIAGGAISIAGESIGLTRDTYKKAEEQRAFELGVQHAIEAQDQPVEITFQTAQGPVSVPVERPAGPRIARARRLLPAIEGVEGAAVVDQALSLGLERTAAALTGQASPPLDLSVPEMAPEATAPVEPTLTQAAARSVLAQPGAAPAPEPAEVTAAPPAPPLAPPPLEAEAPIAPGAEPATPAPATVTQPPPAVQTAPQAVPETPGAPPTTETTPATPEPPAAPPAAPTPAPTTAPAPTPAPATEAAPAPPGPPTAPAPKTTRGLGLRTVLARMFPNLTNLEVVDTAEELPDAVKQQLRERGFNLDALDAVYHNGRVIFNASKFPTGNPTLVYQKVAHEAFVHLGLREALGPTKFARLVQDIWRGLSAADRARIAARNRISPADQATIGEEWLAYEAERVAAEGKSNPIWKRIAATIRSAMRRLGIPLKYSDVEIARLLTRGERGAEAAVTKQGKPRTFGSITRLSADQIVDNPKTGLATLRNSETDGQDMTRFSIRDYDGWREDAVAQITKGGLVDEATAKRWLADLDQVALLNAALAEQLGLLEEFPVGTRARGVGGGTVRPNADYIWTWDGSGICTLRLPAQEYLNAITDELVKRGVASDLSPAEREIVLTRLVVAGMPRMCVLCYVETRRALRGKYAGLWSRWLTGQEIAEEDLTEGMLNPKPNMKRIRREAIRAGVRPEDIDHSVFIDQSRWDAAEADPNSHLNQHPKLYQAIHLQSIQNANLVFERQSYTGQYRYLKDWQKGRQIVQGGLRFYSFSDFLFEHAVDILQAITDAAGQGLPGHVYTKQLDTALLLAKSNMKINLSWVPVVGKDGTLKEWQGNSVPWDEAIKLKKKNPNIGIVFVAFNDEQVRWAMKHPHIGQIIPYHRSGMYKNQFDTYVKQQGWQNFESEQRYKVVDPTRYARFRQEWTERYGAAYEPHWTIGWFLQGQAMTDADIVANALADAERYGIELQFQRFMYDADGNEDPNAAKLLKDYARTDTPQRPLQPSFDRKVFSQLMEAWAKKKDLYGGARGNIIKTSPKLVNMMADDLMTYREEVAKDPAYEDATWDKLTALQLEYAEDPVAALAEHRTTTPILPSTTRMSVSEGGTALPEPVGQSLPRAPTARGVATFPESEEAVKEHDDQFFRFSVTPLAIKFEDMDAALARAGLPTREEMLGKPDAELLANVQARMAREPGWVDSIVDRELKQPGLLSDEETLALDWWMLQLRQMFEQEAELQTQADQAGRPDFAAVHAQNAQFWGKALEKLAEVTYRAGSEAGRAFRARQLALNWDFTLASLINKKKEAVGWRDLTQEEMDELAKTAAKYKKLSEQLEAQNKKLRERDVDAEIAAAKAELTAINPSVLQYAKDWIDSYNKKAKNARDRFRVKWQRLHPDQPLRASIGEEIPPLPDDLLRELAIMGGAKLAANITEEVAWNDAMVNETGEFIRPYLPAARAAAEAHFAAELATGRAEIARRRAPRKVPVRPTPGEAAPGQPTVSPPQPPGQPARPAPPARRDPTPEEELELAKVKLGKALELRKNSTEPTKTASDELYYPVQSLIKVLVSQDPLITRDQLIDQVHAVLNEVMTQLQMTPLLDREQVMDAISGRGRYRLPDPALVPRTIRDLKAQIRLAAHVLDLEAEPPRKPPPTGFQRDKPTDEQRRLTKRFTELKKKVGELISDGGAQLQSYLASRKVYYRNRIADLRLEIANRELINRTTYPPRTDPELEALKAEYEEVRQQHAQIFVRPGLTPEQRLVLAEAAAERLIARMEKDLAEGRSTLSRRPSRQGSAKLEALRTRIVQLKAEQEWAQRHLNPPPDLTEPEDIRRWFQLDKSIRKIEEQLANQNPFGPKKKVRAEDTPTNQRLAAKLEDLKQQRKEMRERLGPAKPSPLEQAILHRMSQLRRQIADYQERIANRDFTPRKRPEPTDLSSNPEAVRLLAQRDKVVNDYYLALAQDRWERKTGMEKVWAGIQASRQAMVNLKSSFDFSGLRQGLIAMGSLVSRVPTSPIQMPKKIASIFYQMFRAAMSRDRALEIERTRKARPNAQSGADRIGGIAYSDIDSPRFTRAEETAKSVFDEWALVPWWEKGKPVKNIALMPAKWVAKSVAGSNRAFATFLNATRATLYDQLLEVNFKDRAPTENEMRILGNWVNVATGRGAMNPATASAAAQVFWAPKLLVSRLQFLIGQPLWGGGELRNSARARKIVAQEYARVIGTGFLLALVASMFDEKKERSPLSSDYGKIVRGNTRIDIWGGLQQMVVLLSRLATGKTKSLKGNTYDLTAKRKYGQPDLGIVLARFLRSKVRPDIGIALDLASRGDFRGEPLTVGGVAEDLVIPLPFAGIADILRDRGFTEGMILEAMNQFGAGVNTYEPSGRGRKGTRTY